MLKEGLKTFNIIREFKKYKTSKDELVRQKAMLFIKEQLGANGGVFTKFFQYMGTQDKELRELDLISDDNVNIGIDLDEVMEILESSYGENAELLENISKFAYTASVGQVHRGVFKGTPVAIKVQYPGIKEIFEKQLKLFNLLPVLGKKSIKKWGIEVDNYKKAIKDTLDRECNYLLEVQELQKWEKYLKGTPYATVPKVISGFERSNVYVQEFCEGVFIEEVCNNWTANEKKELARRIIFSYFDLVFHHGVIQGDTNHGNFLFSKGDEGPVVIFIDLGQTVNLTPTFVNTLMALVKAGMNGAKINSIDYLASFGFDTIKLKHIHSKLDALLEVLIEPFICDYAVDLKEWNYKKNLDLLLGEDKWWFRSAGGTEFFFFMKSFMGLKNLIEKLDCKIFFKGIWNELGILDSTTTFSPPHIEIENEYEKSFHASSLKISVWSGEVQKVKVSLPFNAIFDIENYLEIEIKEKIQSLGVVIDEVVRSALLDGGKPKNIFKVEVEERLILIDLE